MTYPPSPDPGQVPQPEPAQGYQVPGAYYLQPGAPDPLVTGPTEGFNGWWYRLRTTIGRSAKSLVLITLCTIGLPSAVLSAVSGVYSNRLLIPGDPATNVPPQINHDALGGFFIIALVAFIVLGFLSAVAYGAAIWAVTREAAGELAPLGAALGYGLRNSARIWGWTLLYSLMVAAGVCACILPGLYLALAGCLFIPIALYERGTSPISASFSLVNRNFGASLGRMILVGLLYYAVQIVIAIPVAVARAASPAAGLVVSLILELVTSPVVLIVPVAAVILFAELNAKLRPLTTPDLLAALG
jgi:hypothetical protein